MIQAFPSRDLTGPPRVTNPGPAAPFDVIDLDAEPRQPPDGEVRSFVGGFESFRATNTADYPRRAQVTFLPPKIQGDRPALARDFPPVAAGGSIEIRDFFGTAAPPAGFVPGCMRIDWIPNRLGEALSIGGFDLTFEWGRSLDALIRAMPRNLGAKPREESRQVRVVAPREFEFLALEMSATVTVSAPLLLVIPRRVDLRIGYRVTAIRTAGMPPRLSATPFGGQIVRGFDIGRLLQREQTRAVAAANTTLGGAIAGEYARVQYDTIADAPRFKAFDGSGFDRARIVVHP